MFFPTFQSKLAAEEAAQQSAQQSVSAEGQNSVDQAEKQQKYEKLVLENGKLKYRVLHLVGNLTELLENKVNIKNYFENKSLFHEV